MIIQYLLVAPPETLVDVGNEIIWDHKMECLI